MLNKSLQKIKLKRNKSRLDGGWRCWLEESGTAGWMVEFLVERERDGWILALLVGRERDGRMALLVGRERNC